MALKLERRIHGIAIGQSCSENMHANASITKMGKDESMILCMSQMLELILNNKNRFNSINRNKSAKCTFCGMSGHIVDKCYRKHDYP